MKRIYSKQQPAVGDWAAFRALTPGERLSTYLPQHPARALETNETPAEAWAAYWAIVRGER